MYIRVCTHVGPWAIGAHQAAILGSMCVRELHTLQGRTRAYSFKVTPLPIVPKYVRVFFTGYSKWTKVPLQKGAYFQRILIGAPGEEVVN